jgi:hypothetical protein
LLYANIGTPGVLADPLQATNTQVFYTSGLIKEGHIFYCTSAASQTDPAFQYTSSVLNGLNNGATSGIFGICKRRG